MTRRSLRDAAVTPIFAALVLAGCARAAGDDDRTRSSVSPLDSQASIADTTLACGRATSVTVSLHAGHVERTTPVDLMLVLDDSGSITALQFEALRGQLVGLVQGAGELFAGGGRIGVLLFSGTNQAWPGTNIAHGSARLQLAPSGDQAAVIQALQLMPHLGGSTCTSCGIDMASEQLGAEEGAAQERKRVALVITDGVSNSVAAEPPFGAAFAPYLRATLARSVDRAHASGIELFVVGVGSNVDPDELGRIADDPDEQHLFEATRFAMLGATLGSLSSAVALPEATASVLTLTVNPDFSIRSVEADAGGVTLQGQTIIWSNDALRDQTVNLTYQVEHRPGASGGEKPLHSEVDYVDQEGNALDIPAISTTVHGCDRDGDRVPDESDNCPDAANREQADLDADGRGDVCDDDLDGDGAQNTSDNCVDVSNPEQIDLDGDGDGDVCDDDADGDGVHNDTDNCPTLSNSDQADADHDSLGDACDEDSDGDGVPDDADNCQSLANPDQADADSDATGDACDDDSDGDGVPNATDNCPLLTNPDQADLDADATGDVCDDDSDGDGAADASDNCPLLANADQADADGDGVGDACDDDADGDGVPDDADNCLHVVNSDQADTDGDGEGDACENDTDGDGVPNASDNCQQVGNPDQADADRDGQGDACDGDQDGDGIADQTDNCVSVANPDQTDADGDGEGAACDPDDGDDDGGSPGTCAPSGDDDACSVEHAVCACEGRWPYYRNHLACASYVVRAMLHSGKPRACDASKLWASALRTRCSWGYSKHGH